MVTAVCSFDGVELRQNRMGRWIHLGELPKNTDPDHEANPVEIDQYVERHFAREGLRQAAQDMVRHHGSIHPDSVCEFSARLRAALKG